ncbi:MAG: hypothetical protein HKM07_00515 [Chlamydiae bacterium]|nr:hypothetical protein [Chlamydiota bacterium]
MVNTEAIVGRKFHSWTVVSYEGKQETERHWYRARCECGNENIIEMSTLKRGKSRQCRSCARKEWANIHENPAQTHGHSSPKHPFFDTYNIWCGIKQRCLDPQHVSYKSYGGRGIDICPEWKEDFECFLKDMGGRPFQGASIDRIDVNKGYFKENCRWATKEIQANNTRLTVFYEYDGERLSETMWARKLKISRNKFMYWVRKNGIEWVIENLQLIKKMKRGMSNKDYLETGLENIRRTTHGALRKTSPLKETHNVFRGFKERFGADFWATFETFYRDMGKKPEDLHLKRKDSSRPFTKENCCWG